MKSKDSDETWTDENENFKEEMRYWKILILLIIGAWYIVGFSKCYG